MSEVDVRTSLLEEVEGAFGEGSTISRVTELKAGLAPIYTALPKNEKGYLTHATVRYALHRLFMQRNGWFIRGLDSTGGDNISLASGLLKEHAPAYIQDLFEKRLGSQGFGLNDLSVLAATIEHLIHNEATKRMGLAFKVLNLWPTSTLNASLGDEVLDTYMIAYILGVDLSIMTLEEVNNHKADMPELYPAWQQTKEFVRHVRSDIVRSDASAEQKASGEVDFALVARVAERVSEKFGNFQHRECDQLKRSLVKIEEKGTGRVRLSDFYKPAIDGQWQFQESESYLRKLGALDETDVEKPRVIIVNYLNSMANCIASSNFYSVCCMDECEGLFGQLEQQFAAPEATPDQIAKRVAMLSRTAVAAPRTLSPVLLSRLGEIAAEHGGSVPLHGRLFAQWMHHAFPHECPYPHVSGSTKVLTADEFGADSTATNEEMTAHVERAATESRMTGYKEEIPDMPWSFEEELLAVRKPETNMRNGFHANVLFMAIASIAYALVNSVMHGGPGKTVAAMFAGKEKLKV